MRIDVVLLKQWLIRATRDAYLIENLLVLAACGYPVPRIAIRMDFPINYGQSNRK